MDSLDAPQESHSAWAWLAAAAIVAGVALRLFQISEQIPCDDETVSLRIALTRSYWLIFGLFDVEYSSIPHTLLLKLLADSTGLDELTLRLPTLAAGIALLCSAPWLLWRRLGPAVAATFTLLLAISPALVSYSRVARVYAIPIALVFWALWALARWLESGRQRYALAYVGCAVAAIWSHQLTAPALLAPVGVAALLAAHDAPRGQRLARAAAPLGLGAGVCLLVATLLWNALWTGASQLGGKLGLAEIGAGTLGGAAILLAGTDATGLAVLFWSGCALGAGLALRRDFRLGSLLVASVVAQWGAVLVAAPWLAWVPRIFARYVSWSLPCLLLFLAFAIAELARLRVRGRAWPLPLVTASLLAAALLAFGPLPQIDYQPNNFTAHADFLQPPWRASAADPVSEFYQRLRAEPGDFAIVEVPWRNSPPTIPYHRYQQLHRKRVRIGFLGSLLESPNPDEFALDGERFDFRTFVQLSDPAALRARDARYVVVHRNIASEVGLPGPGFDLSPVIPELARRFGPPIAEDATLAVFVVR